MFSFLRVLFTFFFIHFPFSLGSWVPDFLPCDPESEILVFKSEPGEPAAKFCSIWNPDFSYNGYRCCGKLPLPRRKKRRHWRCAPKRKGSYCNEMTAEQRDSIQLLQSGQLGDELSLIQEQMSKNREQAYCSVNNGFLAHGRPLLPTQQNRIRLKSQDRCLNFGTDAMVGMLEWIGRQIAKLSPDAYLVVGDISGPRGGCLMGRSGRRGHASHTSGQDADVGFLPKNFKPHLDSQFSYQFDPGKNWEFLKKVFVNPFACIQFVFLDRKHIRALKKFAQNDPLWASVSRWIRHMPGHKNHFHFRIGRGVGPVGCELDTRPDFETGEDGESEDEDLSGRR